MQTVTCTETLDADPSSIHLSILHNFFFPVKTFILILNVIGAAAYFGVCVHYGIPSYAGQVFGLSILYVVVKTALSFVCWYRTAYKAFR